VVQAHPVGPKKKEAWKKGTLMNCIACGTMPNPAKTEYIQGHPIQLCAQHKDELLSWFEAEGLHKGYARFLRAHNLVVWRVG